MVITVTQPGLPRRGGVLSGGTGQRRRVDGAHQCRDAARTGRRAERGEPPGILPAAGTVLGHPQCGKVAGGGKNFFQQLLCRHAAGHLPQGRELVVKIVHLLGEGVLRRALPRQQQRTVQAHAGGLSGISGVLFLLQRGALCPQPHQVVIRKAEHRPQHGRSQIDVLRRVVDDLQQRDERPDVGASIRFSRASAYTGMPRAVRAST